MNTNESTNQLSDSQIVKRSVKSLKSIYRQGHLKNLPIGTIFITASQGNIANWHLIPSGSLAKRLAIRVIKKLRKPFTKKMNRHLMARKASGKNEVTRR